MKTLVQCDFDGTVTEADVGFLLLDSFAQGDWRQVLQQYREHTISVGCFNTRVFAMVKADRPALLDFIKGKVKVRPGLWELVTCCSRRGFRLAIVSNGLEFYITAVLREIGLENIEVHAAETGFSADGLDVRYVGPDDRELDDGLKDLYVDLFRQEGYRVIYVGDGYSDIQPATHANQIIARDALLDHCRKNGVECQPFDDLNDVVRALEAAP